MERKKLPHGTIKLQILLDNEECAAEEAVCWAVKALTDGYDSPALRELAGLDITGAVSSTEAIPLFESALRELGIPGSDRATRGRAYIREICTGMLAGEITPAEGVELIHAKVVSPLGHPDDLNPWCYLWEGNAADLSRPLGDSERDGAILDYALQCERICTQCE